MPTHTALHDPGTLQHQAILRGIVAHHENDQRILDVVIADQVNLNAVEELAHLCLAFKTLGEHSAVIIPDGIDAGDVVFESLLQLSVRYHPLSATSPDIVDSLHILTGRIDHSLIAAAGSANRQPSNPLEQSLGRCVRYAAVVDVALQRHDIWDAVEALHRMRILLMELYTLTHGGQRPVQFFQANADEDLQALLGHTLPEYSLASLQASLRRCLDILEHDLEHLTNRQIQLPDAYRTVLNAVRVRQAHLKLGG